jgi:threonine/homoserine/homoserine lactone efflux protein
MTLSSALALYATLTFFALLPGPGVMVVIARSLESGFRPGLAIALGILSGDFVFITLAILGLATLAEVMGNLFVLIKYAGAAYLIYLGLQLLRPTKHNQPAEPSATPIQSSHIHATNFLLGLITSLSNPKVMLFYFSFFPAFLDLQQVSPWDIALLFLIASLSVGAVMIGYAYLASRTQSSFRESAKTRYLKTGSGALLIGGGLFVALRG